MADFVDEQGYVRPDICAPQIQRDLAQAFQSRINPGEGIGKEVVWQTLCRDYQIPNEMVAQIVQLLNISFPADCSSLVRRCLELAMFDTPDAQEADSYSEYSYSGEQSDSEPRDAADRNVGPVGAKSQKSHRRKGEGGLVKAFRAKAEGSRDGRISESQTVLVLQETYKFTSKEATKLVRMLENITFPADCEELSKEFMAQVYGGQPPKTGPQESQEPQPESRTRRRRSTRVRRTPVDEHPKRRRVEVSVPQIQDVKPYRKPVIVVTPERLKEQFQAPPVLWKKRPRPQYKSNSAEQRVSDQMVRRPGDISQIRIYRDPMTQECHARIFWFSHGKRYLLCLEWVGPTEGNTLLSTWEQKLSYWTTPDQCRSYENTLTDNARFATGHVMVEHKGKAAVGMHRNRELRHQAAFLALAITCAMSDGFKDPLVAAAEDCW